MATSSTGLTGTTNSNASKLFNGTSRFSSDFQSVITRDVAIASLPIQQLQSETAALQGQTSELGSLSARFSNLQSSIQQLDAAVGTGSLSAASSDATIAQATVASGAQPGTYTLQVNSLGSYTNTLSQAGSPVVSDPSTQSISSSSTFILTVNGTSTTINPGAKTLDGLVSAINSNSALNVQASIVNLGSSASPDYRLSLQSSQLGANSIQLNDLSSNLLDNLSTGSLANYQVDGVLTPITSTSRAITLAPGLTVNLLAQSAGGTSTTISVAPNTTAIQSALSSFVASFNSATDELSKNVGQAGGALQGDSVVYELRNALQSLGNYSSGSGGIASLASLGVTFDKAGHLSLDASAFSSATNNQIQGLSTFLGGSDLGGFLQFANSTLTSIDDSTTGIIQNATASFQNQITTDNALIATDQDRVNTLQTNLQNQLAASDALVASIEQSYSLIAGIFQAQQNNVTAIANG